METALLYNWDDLDVGKYDLEHSQRFFERKHLKHEKLSKDIPDLVLTMEDKENRNRLNQEDHQHNNHKNRGAQLDDGPSTRKAPLNLMHQPFDSNSKHKGPKGEAAPSVYKYAELYEKKKQSTLQRLLEEDRKNRVFHSRPAPNFNWYHDQKKKSSIENIARKTAPVTPKVLKKSQEMEEKRKQKIEEYMKQQKAQKFIPRDAHVLHEEPFKPKKSSHVVDPQPFNLLVEKRLEERKQYDDMIKKTAQVKKKQEEEERKKREEELVRELRKLTSFKARPNPFK